MKNLAKNKVFVSLCFLILISCAERRAVNGQVNSEIPKKAQKFFNDAYEYYQLGEYPEARDMLLSAINKHESYTDAYDLLGRVYKMLDQPNEAIASFRQVLILAPDHFFAMYELGSLYFEINQDSSEYYYSRMLRLTDSDDKYTRNAKRQLNNIRFTRIAMANPVDINLVNLGPGVNSVNEEYSPALTIDGNTLFFTWRDGALDYYTANEDIYYSTKDDKGIWSKAKPIGPPINTAENEGAFSVTADGRYIFFTSCKRSGGVGRCDIWITSRLNDNWSEPINPGVPLNSKDWESQPCISSDGRKLYFASDRPGGYGGIDLWVSTFTDSGWSKPQNLGPEINTIEDEQFPFIHPDGTTLYFSSYGHPGLGNADLYVSHIRPDGSFAKPENLGYPINTIGHDWNLIVGRDGKTAYYSSDDLSSGEGGMDIYSFELPETKRAQQVSYLKGNVYDAETMKKLGAQVELIPLPEGEATLSFAPDKTGQFVVALRGNTRYALNVQSKGYLFYSEHFDMPAVPTNEPYEINVPLKKVKVGNSIVLRNIFFDTDLYELKPESTAELEKLYQFMLKNESLRIEISGHTDNQGSPQHNKILSENRALAVYNYLVERGISKERLEYKGYGDTQPIADNTTEEGRAKNRRTEFKILL